MNYIKKREDFLNESFKIEEWQNLANKIVKDIGVKLYFMYGLPTETMEDLQAIVDLVKQSKKDLVDFLTRCKKLGKKVISYGATSKSSTVFNYCKIDSSLIDYVTDTTPEKIGKLTPGSHIPIKYASQIESDVDVVYLGAWNFVNEILSKESDYVKIGRAHV